MQYRFIGIDIGGTQTRIGVFTEPGAQAYGLLARFPTCQDYEEQRRLLSTAIGTTPCAGIGVSIGAQLARDGQSVGAAPNLPAYVGRPLAADLAAAFLCPVRLAHDPVCGLLAEMRTGVLQQHDRCAYLTLSTGTGAAIHLGRGTTALTVSIQVGHQILDGNSLPCLCGQVGCLETFTGGRQIHRWQGKTPNEIDDPAFWEHFTEKLALGLVNLAQLTRVETVAVSGAIALNRPALLPLLQQKIDAQIRTAPLVVQPAALGEDAPLIGATVLLETAAEHILH